MDIKTEIMDDGESVIDTVVNLFNEASASADDQEKVNRIVKIQELIIHREPALLDNFLDEVTAFQHDRAVDVRKSVVGFIEEACKKDNEILVKVMPNLQMLFADDSVAVQKRVCQALTLLYRVTLGWLSRAPSINEEMEKAWKTLCQMKVQVAKMIDHDNDGVRTLTVKFYEMLIITQTYPEADSVCKDNEFSLETVPLNLKVARPRKLEEEARQMFEDLLKFHGSAHISSANLMACMGSLTHIAKSRPQFLERIVGAMEQLHANLPPTLSKSQVSSVRKHMKLQLLAIIKHPASYGLCDTIRTLLSDLGATSHEINKVMPSAEEVARHPRRPAAPVDVKSQPPSKKRRYDSDSEPLPGTPPPQLMPGANQTEQFVQQNLSPKVAAELVVASIGRVPNSMPPFFRTQYVPLVSGPPQAQVQQVSRSLAAQMINANVGPEAERRGIKREKDDFDEDDVVMPPAGFEGDASLKKDLATSAQVAAKGRAAPMRPMKLTEMAKPLTAQANSTMARSALQRILRAERTAMLGGVATVRQKVITSLATVFPDDLSAPVLEYVMADPRARIELMLSWLYEIYSWIKGFCRRSVDDPSSEGTRHWAEKNYEKVFCSMIDQLMADQGLSAKDRDGLLVRLYLESPLIPEEGVDRLSCLCREPTNVMLVMDIVRQLVYRPSKQHDYLDVLLEISSHEDEEMRTAAINFLLEKLYSKSGLSGHIEDHAVKYLDHLLLAQPPSLLCTADKGQKEPVTAWTEETIKACLYLFLAVLCSNEKLVHKLAAVYVQANADVKRTILRLIDGPIRTMGMHSPELLLLVETCPKGAETLVTKIIHILTDKSAPSAELVERVRDMYHRRVSDVRCLIPVLNGLTKKEVLSVLPKLIKQNPDVVKQVFNRLLGIQSGGSETSASTTSPLKPTELLVALHNIDATQCDIMTVMKATSLCFSERSVYTQETLAVVIQQLMDHNPLPTLLMRTVLQSLTLYPRLSGFVMHILQRLIVKQVWKQKKVWEGFIKCCQRTKPQSFAVVLQLPPQYLQELLNTSPDLKEPLLAHVASFSDTQRLHISKLTMDVLSGSAQFQAENQDDEASNQAEDGRSSPEPMEQANEPCAPGE